MDKTMKRQIGYIPTGKIVTTTKKVYDAPKMNPGMIDEFATTALSNQIIDAKKEALIFKGPKQKPTSENVVHWINDHPFFKWSSMCLLLGIDKGNFGKILKDKTPVIKQEQLEVIIEIIENYGYGK